MTGMQAHQPPVINGSSPGPRLEAPVPAGPRPVLFAEQVGPTERVLVIGKTVFGGCEQAADRFRRLAAACDCVILEVGVAATNDRKESVVCYADPFPAHLRDEEVEALAAWLVAAASRTAPR